MKLRRVVHIAAALVMMAALAGCGDRPDSVSGASLQVSSRPKLGRVILPGRPVIVTPSERGGAARLASAIAPSLGEEDPHKIIRELLTARGCEIVGEFNCVGYNDNSFLFLIGGINRGRPDAKDISLAEAFADSLLQGGGT